jgi:NADH dehydrogenase
MHVFLTGGTGFVGGYVLRELIRHGHTARCLVRSPDARLSEGGAPVERVVGDVTDAASLDDALDGCDAAIHLVGIIDEEPDRGVTFEAIHVEGTIHVARAAQAAGVDRFIHLSANGAAPDGVSAYQTTKWRAEQYIRDAGFDHWTIIRPSIVFGDPGDRPEFASRLARTLVRPFPVLPVFGNGTYQLQPIDVDAVATACVQALDRDAVHTQTYCAAGHESLAYTTVLNYITQALGQPLKPKLFMPLWFARPFVHVLSRLGLVPISIDQLDMLVAGNVCDPTAFYRDFDVSPTPFLPRNLTYLRKQRAASV